MDIAPMADHEQVEDTLDVKDAAPSSDAPEQDVTPAVETEPASMAEAVEAAMKEKGDPSDPGTEAAKGEDGEEADPKADADGQKQTKDAGDPSGQSDGNQIPEGDPTEEELKDYSQKANARIRDLVSQRNDARHRAEAVAPLVDFIQKNDIPSQDLDIMLDLTARLRHGDFAGFLQGVQPYMDLAQQYTGQALPADLQQQVKQGYVSPQIAKELAQRRAQVQVEQNRSAEATERHRRQQAEHSAGNVRTAITQWEQKTRQSDPDYDLKADMLRRTSQAMMQEYGTPRNPEQALQLVQAAYAEVNGQTQRLRPAPKPTASTPRSTGQQGGTAPTAEPKSMMEAAMQGLEKARRA